MKPIYKSKTFWIAIVQLLIGLLGLVEGFLNNPDYTVAGIVLISKSVVDIIVRFRTNSGVRL